VILIFNRRCCRKFLLRVPVFESRQVDHPRGDPIFQKGLGRICQSEDGLSGTESLCAVLCSQACSLSVYSPNSVSSPILQKLSGVFEVRIYPEQYSIPNIVGTAKEADDSGYIWPSRISNGVDLDKLRAILDSIDYASIKRRRATYSRLYHEAHQQGHDISFTGMLLLLAHHKIIVDREALVCVYHYTSASLY
jgi:hypothetical protein